MQYIQSVKCKFTADQVKASFLQHITLTRFHSLIWSCWSLPLLKDIQTKLTNPSQQRAPSILVHNVNLAKKLWSIIHRFKRSIYIY